KGRLKPLNKVSDDLFVIGCRCQNQNGNIEPKRPKRDGSMRYY
ncbi:hypothetical protein HMPREF1051_1857, partial [Neisseria sicca VK64]